MLADSFKLGSKHPVPIIHIQDVATGKIPSTGSREFSGTLKSGESVRFIPIRKESTQKKRLLSIYGILSNTASIQKLYGLFKTDKDEYAVMEELQGDGSPFLRLDNAFTANETASVVDLSRNQRLILCYEISLIILYLHEQGFVAKVISDRSLFVRKVADCLVPVLSDLEQARSV